jgi:predicted nucleic acid-binding protein
METKEDDDTVFIDANVLIYAKQEQSAFHEVAQRRLEDLEQKKAKLWVNRQILRGRQHRCHDARSRCRASADAQRHNVADFERFDDYITVRPLVE